jgi:hypothetical protein
MKDQPEERRLLDEVDGGDSDDVATQLSVDDEVLLSEEQQDDNDEIEPVVVRPRRKPSFTLLRIAGLVVALCLGTLAVLLFAVNRRVAPLDDQLAIPLHPTEHSTRDPTTLTFDWHVTLGVRAPDGVEKQVYLINGG